MSPSLTRVRSKYFLALFSASFLILKNSLQASPTSPILSVILLSSRRYDTLNSICERFPIEIMDMFSVKALKYVNLITGNLHNSGKENHTMDSVALVKFQGDLKKTLTEGIDLIGGLGSLKSPVIIKPNICTGDDRTGVANTSVAVVQALVTLFLEKDRNLSIKIVESDSGAKFADEAFEAFGYKVLEKEMKSEGFDVSLINLSHSSTAPVQLDGLYLKDPELPTLVAEPGFCVSLAVAKTHGLTFITGTLKNLFGLLPKKDKFIYHPHLSEVIVDLNRIASPKLCIVDARVGLEGWEGPRTRPLNAFIIGRKPVSVDSTMAKIMGFNPEKIHHLLEAAKFDLGMLNPRVTGCSIESIKVQFNPPTT
jgi:uncharacterized protein (DUF362 family)